MTGQMTIFDYEQVEKKKCRTCDHFHRCTSGPDGIYHGFSCFGFGISRSENPEKDACIDYREATDDEAWRRDDKAFNEWFPYFYPEEI